MMDDLDNYLRHNKTSISRYLESCKPPESDHEEAENCDNRSRKRQRSASVFSTGSISSGHKTESESDNNSDWEKNKSNIRTKKRNYKQIDCPDCSYIASSSKDLTNHRSLVHQEGAVYACKCGCAFLTQRYLDHHIGNIKNDLKFSHIKNYLQGREFQLEHRFNQTTSRNDQNVVLLRSATLKQHIKYLSLSENVIRIMNFRPDWQDESHSLSYDSYLEQAKNHLDSPDKIFLRFRSKIE